MIHSFITFIEQVIIPYGALGVFLAEIMEEIVVPIPSALVLFTSGFVLLKGAVSFELLKNLIFIIGIPGTIGLTLGSLVIYYLSFYGGKTFILKYGNYLGISWQEVLDFDEKMNKSIYDEYLFIFARIIPLVPSSLIAVFAGVTRMPVKKYIILTFIGSIIKATVYGYVGYQVGELYHVYAEKVGQYEGIGLVIIATTVFVFLSYRIYKKYFNNLSTEI